MAAIQSSLRSSLLIIHSAWQVEFAELQERKRQEREEAATFVRNGDHILLLVCQPELSWQQIVAFITPLRAPYLPQYVPIVVLLNVFPPKYMWDHFPDVAFLGGNPASAVDVSLAGAASASKIVMLAGPPEGREPRLVDANAMLISATVENILQAEFIPIPVFN